MNKEKIIFLTAAFFLLIAMISSPVLAQTEQTQSKFFNIGTDCAMTVIGSTVDLSKISDVMGAANIILSGTNLVGTILNQLISLIPGFNNAECLRNPIECLLKQSMPPLVKAGIESCTNAKANLEKIGSQKVSSAEVDLKKQTLKCGLNGVTKEQGMDISKCLNAEEGSYWIPKGWEVTSEKGITTITFKENGGQGLKIGGNVYDKISEGTFKVDENGTLIEAHIISSAPATYVFENEKLSVVFPGTEVTYKDGKITVHNQGAYFKYGSTDFTSLSDDVTFIKTKDGLMIYGGEVEIHDKRNVIISVPSGKQVLLLDPGKESLYDSYKGNAVWISEDGKLFDAKGDGFSVEKSGIKYDVLKNGRIDRNGDKEILAGCIKKVSSDSKTYCNGKIALNTEESLNANNPDDVTTSYGKYSVDESTEKWMPNTYAVCSVPQSISAFAVNINSITGFATIADTGCNKLLMTGKGYVSAKTVVINGKNYLEIADISGKEKSNVLTYEYEEVTMADGTPAYRAIKSRDEYTNTNTYLFFKKDDLTEFASGMDSSSYDKKTKTVKKEIQIINYDSPQQKTITGKKAFSEIDIVTTTFFDNALHKSPNDIFRTYYSKKGDYDAITLIDAAESGPIPIEKQNELKEFFDAIPKRMLGPVRIDQK